MRQRTKSFVGRIIISSAAFLSFSVLVSSFARDSNCTFEFKPYNCSNSHCSVIGPSKSDIDKCNIITIREFD
ncbi:MAG: hypothetical protein Q7S22_08465 [Candidatus Micrarchaeota archaeon]|nr:hypothetical protein [Candidatus Micrarchaeota archaeon]